MKILRAIAVVIFILFLIHSVLCVNNNEENQTSAMPEYVAQLEKLFKEFGRIEPRTKYTRTIVSNAGDEIGFLYLEPYNDDQRLRAYKGKIRLAVATNLQDEIQGVLIGKNTETASFLEYIRDDDFLAGWNKLSLKQASMHTVDAVTGATFSSNAIGYGVKQLAATHSNAPEVVTKASLVRIKDIVLLAWLIVMLVFGAKIKYRNLVLISNIVIFGFVLKGLFSIELLGGIMSGSFSQFGLSIGFVLVLFFVWCYGKNIYCAWVCPFGAVQTLAFRINKKLEIKLSSKSQKFLGAFRLLFLIAVLVLLIADLGNLFAFINPFSLFYAAASFKDTAVIMALVFIISGLFINRPWCRTGCPIGALIDLSSHYSKKKSKPGD